MKHGVSQEEVLREVDSDNMRNVAFEIATQANNHLQKVTLILLKYPPNFIWCESSSDLNH